MEYKSLIELIEKPQSGEWGKDDETGTGIPVIRTTNFTDKGIINYSNIVTRNIPKEKIEKKSLRKGDIIIEKSGGSDTKPVGRVVFFDGEENTFLFNNFTGVLRVRPSVELLPKYLFYYLFYFYWSKGTVKFENKTTGLHNLKLDQMLNSVSVPIIDASEQLRIIDALDKARTIISLREKQIESLDELIKARFVEMFGDPSLTSTDRKKLSDLGQVFTGNTPSMKVPEYYISDDIPFVKPGDIAENDVTCIKKVDSFISENARGVARIIPPNSVLVTCIGTIGKIGINESECCCNQQINYIVPKKEVLPIYLAYCISFFKEVLTDMANAPVVPIINKTQFSAIEVPVAKYDEQNQFADFVKQIDKSKVVVQKALDEAQLLFDSLMQKYFG